VQFARAVSPLRALGIGLLVLGIAAACLSAWAYAVSIRTVKAIESDIAQARREAERSAAGPPAQSATPIPAARVNAINHAIARLNIPWEKLFRAFETDTTNEVGLLALLPDARRRILVVQAEAVNPVAMIAFVQRLRAQPDFQDVYLTKHELRDQEPEQPYRFALEIRWKEGR
jgi:hypothetical protein